MKARLTQFVSIGAILASWTLGMGGCSTAEISPAQAPSATPPPYAHVSHPTGFDIGDLRAIFTEKSAPRYTELKGCEDDLKTLLSLTQSEAEITAGTRELVKTDPVKYHWCFYGKLLILEDALKNSQFLDERQKAVLDAYAFLTPIARAFMQEYKDSRYMRWAVRNYRHVSEIVFYRKLELTPKATAEMVEASNPFALLREPYSPKPILEKYNLIKAPAAPVPTAPVAAPAPGEIPAVEPGEPAQAMTPDTPADQARQPAAADLGPSDDSVAKSLESAPAK